MLSPLRVAHEIITETLFVMGATLSPGLAELLPPDEDMHRLVDQVLQELGNSASLEQSTALKANLQMLEAAESRRLDLLTI